MSKIASVIRLLGIVALFEIHPTVAFAVLIVSVSSALTIGGPAAIIIPSVLWTSAAAYGLWSFPYAVPAGYLLSIALIVLCVAVINQHFGKNITESLRRKFAKGT